MRSRRHRHRHRQGMHPAARPLRVATSSRAASSPGSPGELTRVRVRVRTGSTPSARQPFPRGTRLRRRARRRESARRAGPATAADADAPPSARAPDRRRARRVDARARSSGDATRPRCALLEEERQVAAPETACYARARKGGSLSELLGYSDLIKLKNISALKASIFYLEDIMMPALNV